MARIEDLPSQPAWISLRQFIKDATPPGTSRALRDGLAEAYCQHAEHAIGDYGRLLLAIHPHMFQGHCLSPPPVPEEVVPTWLLRPVRHDNAVIDVMVHPDVLEDFLSTYSPVRGEGARELRPAMASLVDMWQKACRSHPRYRHVTHPPFSERLLAAGTTTGTDAPSEQWVTDMRRQARRARRIVQCLSPRDYALHGHQDDSETGQTIPVIHPFLVCLMGYDPVFINFEGHDKVPAPYQQSHRDLLPPITAKRKPHEEPTLNDSLSLAQTPEELHAVLARESDLKRAFSLNESKRHHPDWQTFITLEQHAIHPFRQRE